MECPACGHNFIQGEDDCPKCGEPLTHVGVVPEPAKGDKLTTRAAGFGVVRLDKETRKITIECSCQLGC